MADLSSIEELMEIDQEWYTPKEVGQIFRVDPKTVIRWGKTGKLDKLKVQVITTPGGHRRYKKADIDRVFNELNPQITERNGSES